MRQSKTNVVARVQSTFQILTLQIKIDKSGRKCLDLVSQMVRACGMNAYVLTWWDIFCLKYFDCFLNTPRPRQDGRLFPDDIFKSIFLNENVQILIKISLTFVPKAPINNIPALVQIMAWRRPGDKPLSEPMIVRLLTHICVTRPQWVKNIHSLSVHR